MNLLDFIQTKKTVLLDGAMGTQLDRYGVNSGGQNNLSNPEVVIRVHRDYYECGCHVLITNTLTMNRIYIETHNVNVEVKKVNLAGVELAKQVAGEDAYVLGDISSTGQLLEPYGTYSESDFYDNFREQAEVLAEGRVDGFIIETMFDLREALCALHACKEAASIPVIASIAFTTVKKGGRTIMGNFAEECAKSLTDAGAADVIGTNCGELSPEEMASVVSQFYRLLLSYNLMLASQS